MSDIPTDEMRGKVWLIAAALAGASIAITSADTPMTRKQQVYYILSGCMTAFFLLPMGMKYMGWDGVEYISGGGFIMGLFWKKFIMKCGEIIDIIRLPWNRNNDQ